MKNEVYVGEECSGHGRHICHCHPHFSGESCEKSKRKISQFEFYWNSSISTTCLESSNLCDTPVPGFLETKVGHLCSPHGFCMEAESRAVCICHYGYHGQFCQES